MAQVEAVGGFAEGEEPGQAGQATGLFGPQAAADDQSRRDTDQRDAGQARQVFVGRRGETDGHAARQQRQPAIDRPRRPPVGVHGGEQGGDQHPEAELQHDRVGVGVQQHAFGRDHQSQAGEEGHGADHQQQPDVASEQEPDAEHRVEQHLVVQRPALREQRRHVVQHRIAVRDEQDGAEVGDRIGRGRAQGAGQGEGDAEQQGGEDQV